MVYAYSKTGSDGSVNPNALQTEDMQARLPWNAREQAKVARLNELEQSGKSPIEAALSTFKEMGLLEGSAAPNQAESRLGQVAANLNETQKSFLNLLYTEADKKGEGAVKKVNALAQAFATLNFATAFFNPSANNATSPARLLDSIQFGGATAKTSGPLIMPTGALHGLARQLVNMANYLSAHAGQTPTPTVDQEG